MLISNYNYTSFLNSFNYSIDKALSSLSTLSIFLNSNPLNNSCQPASAVVLIPLSSKVSISSESFVDPSTLESDFLSLLLFLLTYIIFF